MKVGRAEVTQAGRKTRKERRPMGKCDVFKYGASFVEQVTEFKGREDVSVSGSMKKWSVWMEKSE